MNKIIPMEISNRNRVASILSNVAYVGCAIILMMNAPQWVGLPLLVMAIAGQIVLGIMSGWFHATLHYESQKMDMVAIVWLLITAIAYNVDYFMDVDPWLLTLLALLACWWVYPHRAEIEHWQIGVLAMVAIILVGLRAGHWIPATGFFGAALVFAHFANKHEEGSLHYDLYHGFPWHGITAVALLFLLL